MLCLPPQSRKPVYSRKEWNLFASVQEGYSANARNKDLTAGHLPPQSNQRKRVISISNTPSPTGYTSAMSRQMSRQRTPHTRPVKQHVKAMNESQSVMIVADTTIDGTHCSLTISELRSSFHDAEGRLTHATSGLLVSASSSDGGNFKGEGFILVSDLQALCSKAVRNGVANDCVKDFIDLQPFPSNRDLYPTFEVSISAEAEAKVLDVAMANTYVSKFYSNGETKLKVSVGQKHTKQFGG